MRRGKKGKKAKSAKRAGQQERDAAMSTEQSAFNAQVKKRVQAFVDDEAQEM